MESNSTLEFANSVLPETALSTLSGMADNIVSPEILERNNLGSTQNDITSSEQMRSNHSFIFLRETLRADLHWRSLGSFREAILAMDPRSSLSIIKVMTVCNFGSLLFHIHTALWWVDWSISSSRQSYQSSVCTDDACYTGSDSNLEPKVNQSILFSSCEYMSYKAICHSSFKEIANHFIIGPQPTLSSSIKSLDWWDTKIIWLWLVLQIAAGLLKLIFRLNTFVVCRRIEARVLPFEDQRNIFFTMMRQGVSELVRSRAYKLHSLLGRFTSNLVMGGFFLYFLKESILYTSAAAPLFSCYVQRDIEDCEFAQFLANSYFENECSLPGRARLLAYLHNWLASNLGVRSITLSKILINTDGVLLHEVSKNFNIFGDVNSKILIDVCCTNIVILTLRLLLAIGVIYFHASCEQSRINRRRRMSPTTWTVGLRDFEFQALKELAASQNSFDEINSTSPRHKYAADSSSGCSICLDSMEGDLMVLPCDPRHRFHRQCATDWLNRRSTCPLCQCNVRRFIWGEGHESTENS